MSSTSMSASVASNGVDLQNEFTYSIQILTSGAGVGEFKLQASNDAVPQSPAGVNPIGSNVLLANPSSQVVNWSDISGTQSSISVTGSTTVFFKQADAGYRWVRLAYTSSSGTGFISSANFVGKGY